MWDALLGLLPTYNGITAQTFGLYILAGAFGALVRVSWLDKPLRGFYRDDQGGIRMGFYAEVIMAVAVSILVDGHPIRAGTAAVFAPWILEAIRVTLVDKLPKMLKAAIESTLENPDQKAGD